MMLRIIHGKLKPGTWDSYEHANKDVMKKAGKIPGLRGRLERGLRRVHRNCLERC
jgi:hypothetical protein